MPNATSEELAKILNGVSTHPQLMVDNIASLTSALPSSVLFIQIKNLNHSLRHVRLA